MEKQVAPNSVTVTFAAVHIQGNVITAAGDPLDRNAQTYTKEITSLSELEPLELKQLKGQLLGKAVRETAIPSIVGNVATVVEDVTLDDEGTITTVTIGIHTLTENCTVRSISNVYTLIEDESV